ncbi:BrnA antitoxin family protein [Brucella anthropi]|uniref:BrnA antitoxin family protein n=1 Tax=Brucella anthropi TaxID=529 RepID=UPI000F677683|nr:BrnA antitoxin family protein [Brucella anthropi]RRY08845.1 hypothetical protein EGJ58_13175 [Brucella anthropi]
MTNNKRKAIPPLTDAEEAEIQREIAADPDAPELTDEQATQRMTFAEAVRRTRGPGKKAPKETVTLRLDPDVVEAFKADGPGWQGRVNEALRKAKKLPNRAA